MVHDCSSPGHRQELWTNNGASGLDGVSLSDQNVLQGVSMQVVEHMESEISGVWK